MTQLHSQHVAEDEFSDDTPFVLADEPLDDHDGVPITLAEAMRPDPLDLAVLLHWRFRQKDGQPLNALAIWASLTEQGMLEDDAPVTREGVQAALDRLAGDGTIALGGAV